MPCLSRAVATHIALAIVMATAILAPGMAVAQQSAAERQAMMACRADYQALCANVQPGGGRILVCLHQHADKVSSGCKQALMSLKQK